MICNLQFLRGLASVLIIFSHAHGLIRKRYEEIGLTDYFWTVEQGYSKVMGAVGVDLFIVLAGFIIFYTTWGKNSETTTLSFLLKRFIRIYPIWWVALAFTVLLSFLPGSSSSLTLEEIVFSYLLFPYYLSDGSLKPILEVGWTLYYIVFYYIIFSLLIRFPTQKLLKALSAIFLYFSLCGLLIDTNIPIIEVITNPRTLSFVIGGWIAYIYKCKLLKWSKLYTFTAGLACCVLLSAFIWIDAWRLNVHSLITRTSIASLILLIFLFDPVIKIWKPTKFLNSIGEASYSVYLFHMFPIMLLSGLWKRGFLHPPEWLPGIIVWLSIVALGLISGCLAYRFIEKPSVELLRKQLLRSSSRKSIKPEIQTAVNR